jgi:hypothetical protein
MNWSALESAVARATGETRRTVRHYGFSLVPDEAPTIVAEHLGLDCPGCGARIALSSTHSTLPELAECPHCDAAFPYEPEEIYLAETADIGVAACA